MKNYLFLLTLSGLCLSAQSAPASLNHNEIDHNHEVFMDYGVGSLLDCYPYSDQISFLVPELIRIDFLGVGVYPQPKNDKKYIPPFVDRKEILRQMQRKI